MQPFAHRDSTEARLIIDTPPTSVAQPLLYERDFYDADVHDECMFYHNSTTRLEHMKSDSRIKVRCIKKGLNHKSVSRQSFTLGASFVKSTIINPRKKNAIFGYCKVLLHNHKKPKKVYILYKMQLRRTPTPTDPSPCQTPLPPYPCPKNYFFIFLFFYFFIFLFFYS